MITVVSVIGGSPGTSALKGWGPNTHTHTDTHTHTQREREREREREYSVSGVILVPCIHLFYLVLAL